jgi:hypothetical protein
MLNPGRILKPHQELARQIYEEQQYKPRGISPELDQFDDEFGSIEIL